MSLRFFFYKCDWETKYLKMMTCFGNNKIRYCMNKMSYIWRDILCLYFLTCLHTEIKTIIWKNLVLKQLKYKIPVMSHSFWKMYQITNLSLLRSSVLPDLYILSAQIIYDNVNAKSSKVIMSLNITARLYEVTHDIPKIAIL